MGEGGWFLVDDRGIRARDSGVMLDGAFRGQVPIVPNDPKLSDRGGWRGPCMVRERRRQEAGAVTAVAVRCSAWLGRLVLEPCACLTND